MEFIERTLTFLFGGLVYDTCPVIELSQKLVYGLIRDLPWVVCTR